MIRPWPWASIRRETSRVMRIVALRFRVDNLVDEVVAGQ